MSRPRSDSGSTISHDTFGILRCEEEYKSEYSNRYSVPIGTGSSRNMWQREPWCSSDRSSKRLKISHGSFDGKLPNQMIEAVLTCAKQVIKEDEDNVKRDFLNNVKDLYRQACIQFKEKREGRIQELELVLRTENMVEWLEGSNRDEEEVVAPLKNIFLPSWSADIVPKWSASLSHLDEA